MLIFLVVDFHSKSEAKKYQTNCESEYNDCCFVWVNKSFKRSLTDAEKGTRES